MRVFADKFTTPEDKAWFDDELNAVLEKPREKGKGDKKLKEDKVSSISRSIVYLRNNQGG